MCWCAVKKLLTHSLSDTALKSPAPRNLSRFIGWSLGWCTSNRTSDRELMSSSLSWLPSAMLSCCCWWWLSWASSCRWQLVTAECRRQNKSCRGWQDLAVWHRLMTAVEIRLILLMMTTTTTGQCMYSFLEVILSVHLTYVCLTLYRTMPFGYASVLLEPHLSVEANEPPLNLRRQKLSLQYALRLSSNYQNPAYNVVFNTKFGRFFSEQTQSDSSTWHSCIIWSSCSRIQKEIYCTINHHGYSSVASYSAALWLISDFTARTKILLLPKFLKIVFMNCVTATAITIASTQMVPKVMTG